MKKLLLAVSLVFLVSPAMADRWEYDGASYKPYVSCTSDVQRRSMKWQTAIPPYDKAIFYKFKMLNWKGEVESIRTALLQWTKPKINPSTGKIQMTLNAKPLEGNTNAMITYQGGTGGGKDWRSGTRVTANKNSPLQGRQHWFKLNTSGPERSQEYTIKISISGGCSSENVAVYGFSRVKEFIDDFSSSSDSGAGDGMPSSISVDGKDSMINSAVGHWSWFNGGTATLTIDGRILSDGKQTGTYECTGNVCELKWYGGKYLDTLTLSSDGKKLEGKNQNGTHVWGNRVDYDSRVSENGRYCVTITSKNEWQEINVPVGFHTISKITGSWNVYHSHKKAGPEGYKGALEERMHRQYKRHKFVKNLPFAALLMKNVSGEIIWVKQAPHVFRGKKLLFRINDNDNALSDNRGELELCFGH